MDRHHKINYLEIPASDIQKNKQFFSDTFGWRFQDYGPDYCAIENAGIDGGFFRSDQAASTESGSVLIVLYSNDLKETQLAIQKNGGQIIKDIFSFPGGKRFHFEDPCGNEYAVWVESK